MIDCAFLFDRRAISIDRRPRSVLSYRTPGGPARLVPSPPCQKPAQPSHLTSIFLLFPNLSSRRLTSLDHVLLHSCRVVACVHTLLRADSGLGEKVCYNRCHRGPAKVASAASVTSALPHVHPAAAPAPPYGADDRRHADDRNRPRPPRAGADEGCPSSPSRHVTRSATAAHSLRSGDQTLQSELMR